MSILKYFDGTTWQDINGKMTGDTLPIGGIIPFGSATAPTNWLVCDGSAVSRTTYSELFAVIGTSYGAGDGSTTFNLPNLKGKVPVGQDTSDTSFDVMGETGGEKTHTLTASEIPALTYQAKISSPVQGSGWYVGENIAYGTNNDVHQSSPVTINSNAGGGAHNNLQPYQVVCYIIKAKQSAGLVGNVTNVESESTTDTYSCDYSNSMFDFLRTNKTILPDSPSNNCLMIDDTTTKNVMLYYNPTNAPETNKMVMWTAFRTDNTGADAYWTYIVLAITLDDHKFWLNAYHNSTSDWMGWQQM